MSEDELKKALFRAGDIINWMAGHIGRMCPPPEEQPGHYPKRQTDGRPLDQPDGR